MDPALNEVMQAVIDITTKSHTNTTPANPATLTEKGSEVHQFFNSVNLPGIKGSLETLASIIVGENVSTKTRVPCFRRGLAVVPVKNKNDHNYKLGKVALFLHDGVDNAYKIYGDGDFFMGNHLPHDAGLVLNSEVRPATKREIERYFAKLPKVRNYGATKHELAKLLVGLKSE